MVDRPLRHLLISREFPPASYPPGGIGTYAAHLARLLAAAGETVHVIGERWRGAPERRLVECDGRLVIHRVALDEPLPDDPDTSPPRGVFGPARRFARRAARLAEELIDREEIDLVEGQDWEAPLSDFLLRRALGLGARRRPPAIVHLHSPTEFIYRHNEWTGRSEYLPARRFEEYAIRAADGWFCPSRYLAREAATRYRIPADEIAVLPYPLGETAPIGRSPSTWTTGSVLFLGRLEPRKGILEFVEAAIEVARENEGVRFDFVGDDIRYPKDVTVRRHLERRLPDRLRSRFRFHGVEPRSRVAGHLAGARLAVVPSRWDNFPNSCIEALGSGLPVLVSPTGGMAEMVEDGVTGWIAPSQSPAGLAATLRRALAHSPDQLAAMGRAAVESIRGLTGNEITVRRHLARRRELVRDRTGRPDEAGPPSVPPGIGLIVCPDGSASTRAVESARSQTLPPARLAVVEEPGSTAALSRAIRTMRDDPTLGAVALVPAGAVLETAFVERCAAAFARWPELGVLAGWIDRPDSDRDQAPPAFPYQWLADEIGGAAVARVEALAAVGELSSELPREAALWETWTAIMLAGWAVSSYPRSLARVGRTTSRPAGPPNQSARDRLRARFPEAFARDAAAVAELEALPADDGSPGIGELLGLPLRLQLGLALDAVRRPRQALRWLGDRLSGTTR